MRELKEALAGTGRQVKISAAVFPDANNARVLIGQDWAEWARLGLVDMLCPMFYTNDTALFDKLTKRAVAIGKLGKSASGEKGEGGGITTVMPVTGVKEKSKKNKGGAPALAVGPILVCRGIGIGTSHNQNTPEIMLEEIRLARATGANGVIFFSGGSLTAPFLEKLKEEAP